MAGDQPLAAASDPVLAIYPVALPQVYGHLLPHCGSAVLAEDLASETFLAAVNASRQGRLTGVSTAWLLEVARHKLVDYWRRHEPPPGPGRRPRPIVRTPGRAPRASAMSQSDRERRCAELSHPRFAWRLRSDPRTLTNLTGDEVMQPRITSLALSVLGVFLNVATGRVAGEFTSRWAA
jgi:DNA-directed RNA polymerase specialized sigma24 family protein